MKDKCVLLVFYEVSTDPATICDILVWSNTIIGKYMTTVLHKYGALK